MLAGGGCPHPITTATGAGADRIIRSRTTRIDEWKRIASTPSRTRYKTWASGPASCGGIFDYDAKKSRLVEVSRALEDPGVWNDAKRAQDLGKERSTLESTVTQASGIGYGKFRLTIAEGNAVWETTETYGTMRDPRPGDKISIKRGPLGSYLLRIGNNRGVKGKRVG